MTILRKFRWPIVLFLAGLAIRLLGAWCTITHHENADTILSIGFFAQMAGVFIALFLFIGLLFIAPQESNNK